MKSCLAIVFVVSLAVTQVTSQGMLQAFRKVKGYIMLIINHFMHAWRHGERKWLKKKSKTKCKIYIWKISISIYFLLSVITKYSGWRWSPCLTPKRTTLFNVLCNYIIYIHTLHHKYWCNPWYSKVCVNAANYLASMLHRRFVYTKFLAECWNLFFL